jgi:hypothetical protein
MEMDTQAIRSEIAHLHNWAMERDCDYLSINTVPEPKWVDYLRSRSVLFGVGWRQLFRLSPVDLRPLFGCRGGRRDSKATILFAFAYLDLKAALGQTFDSAWQECARRVLDLRSPRAKGFGVRQNNVLYLKAYHANEDDISALLTAWAGRLFVRVFRYTGNSHYLDLAGEVARYFLDEHPRTTCPEGTYFYYDPNLSDKIFNASGEISSYLVEYGALSGDLEAREMGQSGLQYLISNQNGDGSWFYGAGPRFHYIDNFHTAFVLNAIASATSYLSWDALTASLNNGIRYFTSRLFRDSPSGLRPIHLDRRFLPLNSNLIQSVDLRDVTASVVLFLELAKTDARYREHADRVLQWALNHMRSAKGTYYPEITVVWSNEIPYIEFQAWMLYCLARYQNLTAR